MGNTTLFKGKITGYHTSDSSRWWPHENGRTVKQGWSGASCVSDTTGVLWVVSFGSGTKWMGLQKNSANLTSLIVNLALGWHSICATTEYGASFPSLSLTVWLQFVCIKTLAFFCFQLECWPFQLFMFHQWENMHLLLRALMNLCSPVRTHSLLRMCIVFHVVPRKCLLFSFCVIFLFSPFLELPQWEGRFPANGHALHRH